MSERALHPLSIYPQLDATALRPAGGAVRGSVLERRRHQLLGSGRAALEHALRSLRMARGDEVLLPAYCCLAMQSPIEALGARAVHYPLREDLSFDVEDVAARVGPRTRAVLAVHYFGIAADLAQLRALCDAHRIALIEDCAHAFYTRDARGVVGRAGHFAVASIMKFLPSYDGGALIVNDGWVRVPPPRGPGLVHHARAWFGAPEGSTLPGVRAPLRALARLRRAWVRVPEGESAPVAPSAVEGSLAFDPRMSGLGPASLTPLLLRLGSGAEVRERRRAGFARLAEALHRVRGIAPLVERLPEGAVPYAFPCLADDGDRMASALRARGVQVFRWEFTEAHDCATTRRYARNLLHLPCHQSMRAADFARLARELAASTG
jgi:perosamine synthetase